MNSANFAFCVAKETINKVKRQLTKLEKSFSNNIHDMGLISKIYKSLIYLNNKNQPVEKSTCIDIFLKKAYS